MKKKPTCRVVLPVLLLAIYIFGLFFGALAVSAYPVYRQKLAFGDHAQTIAVEYPKGIEDTIQSLAGPNMRILIYDADGTCIHHVAPTNMWSGSEPGVPIERYMPSVLSGKDIFKVAPAWETGRLLSDIMVVVGSPIWEQDRVVGAVFLIKNLLDVPTSVFGYAVYFTILYWLSAYFIVSNIRKNKKLDELRQNYIANITHALKTPVASVRTLAEILCDGVEPDPNQQKVYYGMILQETHRQERMIRDILELSKLQSNGTDFTRSPVLPGSIFDPIQEKYTTLFDYIGVQLHLSDQIAQLPTLYTNAACVKELLEILLDNAMKFVSENGNVWIDAKLTGKVVTFSVRDDGIGIEKDALPQVFDRFFKGSHSFNAAGSGLGLAIAKELTNGLNEKIWVESEPNQGAVFYFTVHIK